MSLIEKQLAFTVEEYRGRLARVREGMNNAGIDVLTQECCEVLTDFQPRDLIIKS